MMHLSNPCPPAETPKVWHAGSLIYTRAGLTVLFALLIWGDLSISIKDRLMVPTVQYLLKHYGASDFLIGILAGGCSAAAYGLFLGPTIGRISDRTRTRLGRRIPFLIISVPFIVLSILGLAYAPELAHAILLLTGGSPQSENDLTLKLFSGFMVISELFSTMALMAFMALVNDVLPRTLLGRFFGSFRVLSLLLGIVLNSLVFCRIETSSRWIFISVACLFGLGFLSSALTIKEGTYPPVEESKDLPHRPLTTSLLDLFPKCLLEPYYLCLALALAFEVAAINGSSTFMIPFATSMHVSMTTVGECLNAMFAVSLLMAYPLGIGVDRFHPLRICLVIVSLLSLVTLAECIWVHDGTTFCIGLVLQGILSGCWFTASPSLTQRLLPSETYGEHFASVMLVGAVFGLLFAPALGLVLDHFNHNYLITFVVAATLHVLALCLFLVVYIMNRSLTGKQEMRPELQEQVLGEGTGGTV